MDVGSCISCGFADVRGKSARQRGKKMEQTKVRDESAGDGLGRRKR